MEGGRWLGGSPAWLEKEKGDGSRERREKKVAGRRSPQLDGKGWSGLHRRALPRLAPPTRSRWGRKGERGGDDGKDEWVGEKGGEGKHTERGG
jgi:hypothetical protein